jgi:hypothetical protein
MKKGSPSGYDAEAGEENASSESSHGEQTVPANGCLAKPPLWPFPIFSPMVQFKWSTPSRTELGAEPDGKGIIETVALRGLPQIKNQFSPYRT